jgi:hypothetical protein
LEKKLIFVLGRFRSGSTLVWNLLRNVPGYTAYYEPFHPHLLHQIGSSSIAESHSRITGPYWEEYASLRDIGQYYEQRFAFRQLSMEKDARDEPMRRYLDYLIESAAGTAVALQLNRGDFRIRWLKNEYPAASFLHVHRDARQSWISSRRHLEPEDFDRPTHPDAYELFQWVLALSDVFPFLIEEGVPESSYSWFYYLWRLSFLSLSRNCEFSIDYDEDLKEGGAGLLAKLTGAGLAGDDPSALARFIDRAGVHDTSVFRPTKGYGPIEETCEQRLKQLGLVQDFGELSLQDIRKHYGWRLEPGHFDQMQSLAVALLEEYNRTMDYIVKIDNLRRDSFLARLLGRFL